MEEPTKQKLEKANNVGSTVLWLLAILLLGIVIYKLYSTPGCDLFESFPSFLAPQKCLIQNSLGIPDAKRNQIQRPEISHGPVVIYVPENHLIKFIMTEATYQDTFNGAKPLAPGRKFVVVSLEIENTGMISTPNISNDYIRLVTPDDSIMAPASWSQGLFNSEIGPGLRKEGNVVFDINEKNAQHSLTEFSFAFGKDPSNHALYNLPL
jgi:hypothetical protein